MARLSAPPSGPPAPIEVFGATHPGNRREENEDVLGIFADERLFVVADGMGGRAAGETAARIAVDELESFFRTHKAVPPDDWPFAADARRSLGANLLRVGLKVVNDKIRAAAAATPELHRMGATLAALAVGDTQIVVAHVGDVRVYRRRDGQLARLTRDHSVLEEVQAAHRRLAPDDPAAMGPRNLVTRALGTRRDVEPTVYVNTFSRGDLYLLCSDGLWATVSPSAIGSILASTVDLDVACQRLLDTANEAGGPDNVTALLVRVNE